MNRSIAIVLLPGRRSRSGHFRQFQGCCGCSCCRWLCILIIVDGDVTEVIREAMEKKVGVLLASFYDGDEKICGSIYCKKGTGHGHLNFFSGSPRSSLRCHPGSCRDTTDTLGHARTELDGISEKGHTFPGICLAMSTAHLTLNSTCHASL